MSSTQTQQARQFLAAVEAACADLDPAERSRLVGGLEEHLSELSADGVDLTAELGDPAAYARELRSAAGLATGPTVAVHTVVAAAAGAATGPGAPTGPPTRALPLGPPTTAMPLPVTQPAPGARKVLLVIGAVLAFIAVLVTAALVLGGVFFMRSSDSGVVQVTPAAPAPMSVVVPDLTGQPEAQARQVLAEVGLSVVVETASAAGPVGEVLSQDPSAGTSVEGGSVIRITVSSAP
ncbi:PASTA domain-containing protein [Kineosporia sp. A_224]|uniref:PASTA domain-containing protein n=1 Tax=Kineosporia sp. A_224 TaxID=1962180 RepID=UPI000B4B74CF|nr:PASTA domain-containing protein [Kineosporia sp. A_224]